MKILHFNFVNNEMKNIYKYKNSVRKLTNKSQTQKVGAANYS